ncbi:MAG: hypothetical protein EHM42_11650, partial [Planctomycetaceae bacterium]
MLAKELERRLHCATDLDSAQNDELCKLVARRHLPRANPNCSRTRRRRIVQASRRSLRFSRPRRAPAQTGSVKKSSTIYPPRNAGPRVSAVQPAFAGTGGPGGHRSLGSQHSVAKQKLKGLVIVESPAKAKKINSFLGRDYKVLASMGHVRDLPESAAEIPPEIKKLSWSRLGVNVDADFDPLYVIPAKKKKVISELKSALKDADELILATDEDREGESIGWHLQQVLQPKVPVKRMVFSEITREAIQEAIKNPRQLDQNLVSAQETRRVLDRLYGYTLSPLLWKKVARGLSAGRVQSVAVRLIVQRELERRAFRPATWWDLKARLETPLGARFDADLITVGGRRVAIGKDFDENTGKLKPGADVVLLDEAQV